MKKFLFLSIYIIVTAALSFADIVSVSIENGTSDTINRIKIIPYSGTKEKSKKIYSESCFLGTRETKSFDLDNSFSYEIQLFDTAGHNSIKTDLFFRDSWQKITFTDRDFKAKDRTDILKKYFKMGGEKKSPFGKMTNSCALIIQNRTGKTINDIIIEQNGEKQHYNVSIKNGNQKSIDIRRNTPTNLFAHSSGLEYAKTAISFNGSHEVLSLTKADCTTPSLLESVKNGFVSVGGKIKGLFTGKKK